MHSVLRAPHIRRLFGFSIAARLPLAMLSIGLVVHVQQLTGSFAVAGLVTAAYAVGEGVGGPLLGRLVDRGAQTPVLIGSAIISAVLLLMLAIVPHTTPVAVLVALAGTAGLVTPPVAACLRSQLPALLGDDQLLQTGYALETSLAEVTWVGGPPLILGIGALWSTGAALALCGLVLLVSSCGYAAQQASRSWRPPAVGERLRGGSLRSAMLRMLVLVLFCFGMLLGADEVAVSASAKALEGSTTAAAPLFALWGSGSFIGGLILARFGGGSGTIAALLLWLGALTLGHLALIPAAGGIVGLAGGLLLAGAAIAPTESTVYGMVEAAAPAGTATEAFAWLATAIAVGSAAGAAAGGALAQSSGPAAAYLLGGGAGAAALLIVLRRAAAQRSRSETVSTNRLTSSGLVP